MKQEVLNERGYICKTLFVISAVLLFFSGCKNTDLRPLSIIEKPNEFSQNPALLTDIDGLVGSRLSIIDDESIDGSANVPEDAFPGLLADVSDNKILYHNDAFQRLYPASITKVMTAYVALKYGQLDDTVRIGNMNITEPGAALIGFKKGDVLTLEQLLYALLIPSGNDAGIAIAEHISGSVNRFCQLMNEEAARMGAVDTRFTNPHGLHNDNHYTTAYDLYIIFNEAIQNEKFVEFISTKEYQLSFVRGEQKIVADYVNSNQYLAGEYSMPDTATVIGGKTGTTDKAGYCLITLSESSEKQYISVLLNTDNKEQLYDKMTDLINLAN